MDNDRKATQPSTGELLAGLATTRGNFRLQAHLLSMEAREQWRHLEEEVELLQGKLERGGTKVSDGVAKSVHSVTEAVHGFLQDQSQVVALSTPARMFMQRAVTCTQVARLSRVAQIMWELDCGAVPVVDDEGAVVGIVTDRDVCMAAYTSGRLLSEISVSVTMSHEVSTIEEDTPLDEIYTLMSERKIRRVPVVRDGLLVGIVALADIAVWVNAHGHAPLPAGAGLATTLGHLSEKRRPEFVS